MTQRISNDLFFKNLVASGTISRLDDVEPIRPMRQPLSPHLRSFLRMLGILLVFTLLIALGFAYGVTRGSN